MNRCTKGPWEANGQIVETVTKPWILVGLAYGGEDSLGGVDDDTACINARLMAAAPELLSALKDVIEDSTSMRAMEFKKRLDAARAAIAKAEGSAA